MMYYTSLLWIGLFLPNYTSAVLQEIYSKVRKFQEKPIKNVTKVVKDTPRIRCILECLNAGCKTAFYSEHNAVCYVTFMTDITTCQGSDAFDFMAYRPGTHPHLTGSKYSIPLKK